MRTDTTAIRVRRSVLWAGRAFALALLVVAVAAPAVAAEPEVLTPAEVVTIDRDLDGTSVVMEGEAIGEALHAGDGGVWVNVLADGTAVGVWMPREYADSIGVFGDHRHDGDFVRVSGTVSIACDEHNGEFDIHADTLEIIAEGSEREAPISPWKGIVGVIGVLVFAAELQLFRQLRERRLA